MLRGDTIVGAIGGALAGYVLWLVAISIAGDNATVGRWTPMLLAVSAALAICAAVWGWQLRRRRRYGWAALAFGVPVLPLILTLAVLVDLYA